MKIRHSVTGLKQRIRRFRLSVALFFMCLIIPLAIIVYYGFSQFENEMYYQYRWKSSNALVQINRTLTEIISVEQERPVSHYGFYQYVSNPFAEGLTKELSPLANPNNYLKDIGLIGYFQISNAGELESPLLPFQTRNKIAAANTQLNWDEVERRINIREKLRKTLLRNGLLDKKNIKQANNVWIDMTSIKPGKQKEDKTENEEFETKVESFQLAMSSNHEFIFFRNVWKNEQHYVQGFIVKQQQFLHQAIKKFIDWARYENSVQIRLSGSLTSMSSELENIDYYFQYNINKIGKSEVLYAKTANPKLEIKEIYQSHLISPFQNLNLIFSTDQLPLGSASKFVFFFLIILIVVIVAGCLGFYWLGLKQIALAEQRMNFVSSVSHELKTPLTSILMYSEMLKSDIVKDPKTQLDYHNFIFYESERLSRLIKNILQLSNLSQQQEVINTEKIDIYALKDIIQSKISSMIDKNSFQVSYLFDENLTKNKEGGFPEKPMMYVDLDAFAQIVINLVDNAIKFYKAAKIEDSSRRKIDIGFRFNKEASNADNIVFSIRDYGPGISNSQHNKIFELFYRGGQEMTRTTPGTGIGLALVNELVIAQNGKIEVKRLKQGIVFEIVFHKKA